MHFANKENYRKWLAYKNIHGLNAGTNEKIFIHGKKHKVKHSR